MPFDCVLVVKLLELVVVRVRPFGCVWIFMRRSGMDWCWCRASDGCGDRWIVMVAFKSVS